MSASSNKNDEKPMPPSKSTVVLLLGTISDTTWRMFVPSVGLTILGLFIDKKLHTRPWIMISGILLGSLIAGLLVRRQLKKVQR